MTRRERVLAAAALAAVLVATCGARAAEPAAGDTTRLEWQYPEFRTGEYVATGLAATTALTVFLFAGQRDTPRWSGGILFDDAVRGAARVPSRSGRNTARSFSDLTAITTITWAVAVDSLAVPLFRRSPKVAYQLFLLDAQSFAYNSLFTTSSPRLIGRARPTYAACRKDPHADPLCDFDPTASFWSGHTAQAFTAAGLSCAHHANVPLYGGGLPDALACAGVVTVASATGVLRVAGGRHYATDVLTGAVVGFGFGFGLPMLLHYGVGKPSKDGATTTLSPLGGALGLNASGTF